jgi:hypothetical protein
MCRGFSGIAGAISKFSRVYNCPECYGLKYLEETNKSNHKVSYLIDELFSVNGSPDMFPKKYQLTSTHFMAQWKISPSFREPPAQNFNQFSS